MNPGFPGDFSDEPVKSTRRTRPECWEQDAEEVLAITKTAMLDGMKQLAKHLVEVEGGIGKTQGVRQVSHVRLMPLLPED